MCERLDAVREVRRSARDLMAACFCASLAATYRATTKEPVPDKLARLIDDLSPADGAQPS